MTNFIESEINRLEIEENIRKILYFQDAEKLSIQWGMNYITFSPSKRIRPLLLLESNDIYQPIDRDTYILAAAVELVHTYSLVHDDLPCMDDDELRRGIKTLHTVKNEAYAVLVGDALLTRVFDILSQYSKYELLSQILSLFYRKAGENGMILGQYLDMEGENIKLKINDIEKINCNKTGALIQLSLMLGAINGKANEGQLNHLERIGELFGHIFQIKDDILDITGDESKIGKKIGSDSNNKKSSIPLSVGLDEANKMMQNYKEETIELIKKLPSNNDFFNHFLDFLITREK